MTIQIQALPQISVSVDEVDYLITAMPASSALKFMSKYQEELETGKANYDLVRECVIRYVSKDNMQITEKSFDIMFARKAHNHLQKLYLEVIKFNFEDVFTESDSEA